MSCLGLLSTPDPSWVDPAQPTTQYLMCLSPTSLIQTHKTLHSTNFPGSFLLSVLWAQNSLLPLTWKIPTQASGLGWDMAPPGSPPSRPLQGFSTSLHCPQSSLHASATSLSPQLRSCPGKGAGWGQELHPGPPHLFTQQCPLKHQALF